MADQDQQELAQTQPGTVATPTAPQPPPLPARFTRTHRKTRVGEVVSDRMNKTIIVQTVTRVPHPRFGKIVKQMKKFYAHDEENKAKTGDTVRIMETRPLSKLKRWRLVEVLQK
jgi:small subunit ribosomal protein S17